MLGKGIGQRGDGDSLPLLRRELRREFALASTLILALQQADEAFADQIDQLEDDLAGGAGAPSYVVMSATGDLANERVLTGSTHIDVDDGGAGLPVTLSLVQNTGKLLGRTTAGSGASEEIAVASPLTLSALTLDFDETVPLGNNARVNVQIADVSIGTRRAINFIAGSGIDLSGIDDAGGEEVDLTISTTGVAGVNAAYVTIGNDGSLTAERALTGSTSINVQDNGANSSVVLSVIESALLPDGAEALATAAPVAITLDAAPGAGVANSFSRSDHQHGLGADVPITLTIGGALAEGVSASVARADHHHSVSMNTNRMLGRLTAAFGLVEELTAAQVGGWLVGGVVDHGGLGGLTDDDHTQYLLANGTRALTGNWNAGAFRITADFLSADAPDGDVRIGDGTGHPSSRYDKSDASNFCYFPLLYSASVLRWTQTFGSAENVAWDRYIGGVYDSTSTVLENASRTTYLQDSVVYLNNPNVVRQSGDGTGVPVDRYHKADASQAFGGDYFSASQRRWIAPLFDNDESLRDLRYDAASVFVNYTRIHNAAATVVASSTTLGDATIVHGYTSVLSTFGDGTGSPEARIDADGTGSGTLSFLKDSANTSGKRIQHTTGEDLNFESHNGSAWLEVASIENADHTWGFNRQFACPLTIYAPAGGTQTIDWNDGNHVHLNLFDADAALTLTLDNPNDGAVYYVWILPPSGDAVTITWPAAVEWPGGEVPGAIDSTADTILVQLVYNDALGVYYATEVEADDDVLVNASGARKAADFNDTTPAAVGAGVNVKWQKTGSDPASISAYLAANAVSNGVLRDSGALSVIGRSANSSGDPADISATAASGNVLRESGSTLGFGTLAAGAFATGPGIVTPAMLDNGGALTLLGRSANSSGARADITATAASDAVLRESGSTIGFGTIATAGIANDAVTYAKIQNVAEARILGRAAAAGSGDCTELTAAQCLTILSAFSVVAIQQFTATGANTYTPTSGMKYCLAISTGAGGGGGGADATGAAIVGAGGGGGAGGTAIELFTAADIGASKTVTIGTGGTAGSGTNGTNGGNGGDTTFGSLHTATGGLGGTGSGVSAARVQSTAGGAGSGATNGFANLTGGSGDGGLALLTLDATDTNEVAFASGGIGGASFWGGGGKGGGNAQDAAAADSTAGSQAGSNGVAKGSGGGGGAVCNTATGVAGGTGADGYCLVIEFA